MTSTMVFRVRLTAFSFGFLGRRPKGLFAREFKNIVHKRLSHYKVYSESLRPTGGTYGKTHSYFFSAALPFVKR